MVVGILFVTCLLLVVGSVVYGRRLMRKERSEAVFGNPQRAAGGWHWIVAGVSSLLLLWFYFSWDAARSFFPLAANELCQVAKVTYSINPIRSVFPIDSRRLKGTDLLARDHAQIDRLEANINRMGFTSSEQVTLQEILNAIRSTLVSLTEPEHLQPATKAKLDHSAYQINALTERFAAPDYPAKPTVQEVTAARDQPKWGEEGIEIPILPMTTRGRRFDAASITMTTIASEFVQIKNKSPHFDKQVTQVKQLLKAFRKYNKGVGDLEEDVITNRNRFVKQIGQVFRRVDDAAIFPPRALDPVESAIRRFDEERRRQQGSLGYVERFALPGGSIIASTHACSEQGSGRWLPKPADTVRNFVRILQPDIGYKNVPMLWYEMKPVSQLIAPLIPDWVADLVPGEYPRHTSTGSIPENFKSKVYNVATGNYDAIKVPVPTGHIWDSLVRVFMGLFLGVICGVPLGIYMGLSRFAKGYFDPMIELYRPVPPLAWAPLILTIFGIGDAGKIFLLFMVAFAIMVISARAGATGTQLSKIHAAHSLGASRWQIVHEVILPNSLPEILTGIRVAVGVCWGTLVAAEFLAGTTGIGFVENVARKQSHYEIIWVTIVVLGLLGLTMDLIMRWIIARTIPWRGKG